MRERARANAPVFLLGAVVILWGPAYWPTAVAAEDSPPLLVGALRIATGILPILIAAIVMRMPELHWALGRTIGGDEEASGEGGRDS